MSALVEFPPRGSGLEGREESAPSAVWGHPFQLGRSWDWQPGAVLLGEWEGRKIGRLDDRHIVTVAGTRAGKSTTVLIPNLLTYPGSALVLDPKGELARATAKRRHGMGQAVYILDPFGESGFKSASHNPLLELGQGNAAHVPADASQLAEALIVGNEKDSHWTDSAKNLIRGITLHLLATRPQQATLRELRGLLNPGPDELKALFIEMAKSTAFDDNVAQIGAAYIGKMVMAPREFQSILSTAQEQTAPLNDLRHITDTSDFQLGDLKRKPMTVYLILPAMRMATHFRWLRLMIILALAAMEKIKTEREALPVWFMLEEFPTLGHMKPIETAAGLMAGFGIKLWTVLQDLTQLETHYPKSWETFLGNAGIIQAFGNSDQKTTEYLSKLLGMTQYREVQHGHMSTSGLKQGDTGRRENLRPVRLMEASEIPYFFSRETNRQLIWSPGRPPIYINRLPREAGQ